MAVDYFLKLDGIEGESEDSNHKNEIQLISYTLGGTQKTSVGSGGGSGAGKVSLADLVVVKTEDKASIKLFKALCSGTHIKTGTLTANRAGGQGKPFLKIDFTQLLVTNQTWVGVTEHPQETVSFSFEQIKVDYSVQNAQGNMASVGSVTYNVGQNKVS